MQTMTYLRLNFNKLKYKALVTLIFAILVLSSTLLKADTENYDHLLRSYPEAQKSQIKRVISFTTQKHPGKILGINQQSDNEEQFFKVKLLNPKGQLKTYYINKSITRISP